MHRFVARPAVPGRHRPSRVLFGLLLLGLLGGLAAPGLRAEEGPPGMAWVDGLDAAFKAAKEQDKPIMICINAKRVDMGRREPAAKELREKTYRDARVIELSKRFVCAFLTAEGSSNDFGELRLRFGIDGDIVSPQHIFAYPNGRLIKREEYWPHGVGDQAVEALLKLMNDALEQDRARRGQDPGSTTPGDGTPEGGDDLPTPGDEVADAGPAIPPLPEDPEGRAAWIEEQLARLMDPNENARKAALRALIDADQEGDVVARLMQVVEEQKKQPLIRVEIVRALGRPGLEVAAEPLGGLLNDRDEGVRANAAVSLEYIGSKTSVSDLMKRAPREKDANIANHMYRALGRCGVGESKVRSFLLKKIEDGANDELPSYGPIIGLAYFEKDEKAAKDVQRLLKKWGTPIGGRGWQTALSSALRRTLLMWCLTEVGFGNVKAAEFITEEMIPGVPESRWSQGITDFYKSAAAVCGGDEGARNEVDAGVRFTIGRSDREGNNPLMDDARRGRESRGFEPKGEWGAGRSS